MARAGCPDALGKADAELLPDSIELFARACRQVDGDTPPINGFSCPGTRRLSRGDTLEQLDGVAEARPVQSYVPLAEVEEVEEEICWQEVRTLVADGSAPVEKEDRRSPDDSEWANPVPGIAQEIERERNEPLGDRCLDGWIREGRGFQPRAASSAVFPDIGEDRSSLATSQFERRGERALPSEHRRAPPLPPAVST